MLRVKVITIVLSAFLLTGCYTQLQMSQDGNTGNVSSTTRSYDVSQDYDLYGYNYWGYSSYWSNLHYYRMGSYFARNWLYGDSVYPYNYYRFYSSPQSGFVGNVNVSNNDRPRSIGANRVADNDSRGQRMTDDEKNRNTVRTRANSDTSQNRSRSRQNNSSSETDANNERSREEQRQERSSRLFIDQLRIAEDLHNQRFDRSEQELRRAQVSYRSISDRFDKELGPELSRYLQNNDKSTYNRLRSFFEAQRSKSLQDRVSPFQRNSYERSRSYDSGGSEAQRYRSSSSSNGSDSNSRSSSSSSSRSRSGGDGDSSSGSDRSRGSS